MTNNHNARRKGQPTTPEDKRGNPRGGPTSPTLKGKAKPHSQKEEATTTRKTGKDQTARRKGQPSPKMEAQAEREYQAQEGR